MKKLFIISLLGLTLSSCGIWNKYTREDVNTSELYRQKSEEQSIASLSWRQMFQDPYLQKLIEKALENNSDVRIAALKVEEAEAQLKSARLSYIPSLSLSAQGQLSNYNEKDRKTYNIGPTASWELDIFGKMTNQKRVAKATWEEQMEYAQAVRSRVIAAVCDSYYTLLMLDCQRDISMATLANWDRSIETLKALVAAGRTNDIAVLQARSNRLSLESSLLATENSIRKTENALCALLAEPSCEIERGKLSEQSFPDRLSTGLALELLDNRPDVRRAEKKLEQSFYAVNMSRSAMYPSITLTGSYGWTNSGLGAIVNPGKFLLDAVARLTEPLFNRGALRANLNVARARYEEQKIEFSQTLLDAGNEVNDALSAFEAATKRIEVDKSRVETLELARDKVELLMHYSSTNYLEVLTAQQSLLSASLTLSQDQLDRIKAVVDLYHALGGGVR